MRRAAFLALLLALLLPGVGEARMSQPQRIAKSLEVAARYWGSETTCPAATITVAWASIVDPATGATRGGEALIGGCGSGARTITLNPRPVPITTRCTVIVHEYGHLVGLDHDAGGVMNPAFIASGHIVPACKQRRG